MKNKAKIASSVLCRANGAFPRCSASVRDTEASNLRRAPWIESLPTPCWSIEYGMSMVERRSIGYTLF